ncbi:hypothetical protein DFH08DRAFT_1034895 [Mycena albidolilacea]|uniref:Uncharacterized protein n=1 Tax=Mycena albidolilacea TaxID=1033008 RepID=A0AAD7EFA0_9AGAR|nr:hypothetical protein DFH08DRAFT_1034895 [Mycena albidolilacea]
MLFFLLPLLLFLHIVSVLLNVTIDDTDPIIIYSGTWEPLALHLSGLNYGGTHTISSDSAASAMLTFTDVAVYYLYLMLRWPYAVSTQLSLDGGQGVVVNLTDLHMSTTSAGGSKSAAASVTWATTGLSNTMHRLELTVAPTGNVIVTDRFMCATSPLLPFRTHPIQLHCEQRLLSCLILLLVLLSLLLVLLSLLLLLLTCPSSSSTAGTDSAQTSTVPSKKNDALAITSTTLGAAALLAAFFQGSRGVTHHLNCSLGQLFSPRQSR